MAGSRSPATEFGEKIASVKNDLVAMSKAGTLTRVFDAVQNRNEDTEYYKSALSGIFAEQMTGQKPIEVTLANISALQAIINTRAHEVILNDPAIGIVLGSIADPADRQACQRDIVVAYTNKLTAKVNTDARMSAGINPDSEQGKNVKAYMDFVRHVQNLHDQSPNVVLQEIRRNATNELAEVIKSSRAALLSKKVDLSSSGEIAPDSARLSARSGSSPSSSPVVDRRRERDQYQRSRLDRSSPRSATATSAAAAAAAATSVKADDTPQQLQEERTKIQRSRSPSGPRGGS